MNWVAFSWTATTVCGRIATVAWWMGGHPEKTTRWSCNREYSLDRECVCSRCTDCDGDGEVCSGSFFFLPVVKLTLTSVSQRGDEEKV